MVRHSFCFLSIWQADKKKIFDVYWLVCFKYASQIYRLHSAEVLLQSPHPLLTRRPVEVTDAPEQLSEDRCLFLSQSRLEILQHLVGAGLSVHVRLESYEVAQIHQKLVMLSRWSRSGACSRSRVLLFFLCFFSLAGGQAEVVSGSHLSQQGGGGEWGGDWVTFFPLPAEMCSYPRLLWHRPLNNGSILKRGTDSFTQHAFKNPKHYYSCTRHIFS